MGEAWDWHVMHSWGAESLYLLDQRWARNSGKAVAGCAAFYLIFMFWIGEGWKLCSPNPGRVLQDESRVGRVDRASSLQYHLLKANL